ncbi:aminotransferase class V-fold PLP-dependent enzyme [Shimia abyssi]|uniref:Selenocysteine lyase/cysteine desulfurase n=1 Tax=Shimia abyssi TaxID=1662395 RepID=A0A2P8FGW3_9RHOB|nr:aminotransferase class V-fold PLP-dependent enzyme [Shimia abyssi]PSL20900.1 selenocysteine lyase/cysteine desulfurase [Shimia abyssi]
MTNQNAFDRFSSKLSLTGDRLADLRLGMIGGDTSIETPFGTRKLIYADYVASGRALRQVEDFIMEEVLPFYANSHTEASHCGAHMTRLREDARATVARLTNASSKDHAVIFSGSGATSGLNQLRHILNVGSDTTVLVGPYEHHSNLLPWRESGARVIEIPEGTAPGPDMTLLKAALLEHTKTGPVVVAMSAAANVTGVKTDIVAVTRIVKSYGATMIWDYAGGAPYLRMDMTPAPDSPIDAIVFSGHKFIGGPGASGVLILRRDAARAATPYRPGGGTVAFVNAHQHDYVDRLEQREEGGTPNVIGDIRVALAMLVKDAIGQDYMDARNAELAHRAATAWADHSNLHLLAADRAERLPILSFVPIGHDGQRIDHNAFTRALSDHYGIQARGGCSCAGPYVHHLLDIDDANSSQIRDDILTGGGTSKPGFVRLNLSVLMSDETVDFILNAVTELAGNWVAQAA